MRFTAILLLLALVFVDCKDQGADANVSSSGLEVQINVGEEAVVGTAGLRIRFDSVAEDSRCPIDAICVRAGNARIQIHVMPGHSVSQSKDINTFDPPRSVEVGDYEITLVDLQPHPRTSVRIDPGKYAATFVVK